MIYSLFERECKRPDSVLLQIIIGALHYLPNPRRQARIRRQQIQQGREANFNNAEMDEKLYNLQLSPHTCIMQRANSRIFLSLSVRIIRIWREPHIARSQPLFRFCGAEESFFEPSQSIMRHRNSISGPVICLYRV